MRILLAILWKDLITEWRRRDRVVAMLVFSLLVVVVFHFALPDDDSKRAAENLPGLLWITYIFASLLGLNRAFALELENDALSGLALAPTDRGWIFLGKAAANFVLLGLVQAVTACVFALAFDVDLLGAAPALAGIVALGSAGLCSLGTLFAAMAARTRFREILLPVLLLPALPPILSPAVRGTIAALEGRSVPFEAVQLLLVVGGIYLIVSFLVFEFILDE